jgi:hypothetical protein
LNGQHVAVLKGGHTVSVEVAVPTNEMTGRFGQFPPALGG